MSFADAHRRGALSALLLADLRNGRAPDELADAADALGIDLEHAYVVVVGAPAAGRVPDDLVEQAAGEPRPIVQAVIGERLFALVPGTPIARDPSATVAVGARRTLIASRAAFAEAEHALDTALAFGIRGTVNIDELMPLPIVTATAELAERTAAGRFAKMDALGKGALEIEDTVMALLQHDLSVEGAAQSMGVHRNTVRHRRHRFGELTGLDISTTTDLVTAWWLLRARQARRAAVGPAVP